MYSYCCEVALAFHVPAFQGNHSKKAGTFFPGTPSSLLRRSLLAHVRSLNTLAALATVVHVRSLLTLATLTTLSLRSTRSLHSLLSFTCVHSVHSLRSFMTRVALATCSLATLIHDARCTCYCVHSATLRSMPLLRRYSRSLRSLRRSSLLRSSSLPSGNPEGPSCSRQNL
jgi:hypothetical protein